MLWITQGQRNLRNVVMGVAVGGIGCNSGPAGPRIVGVFVDINRVFFVTCGKHWYFKRILVEGVGFEPT